VVELRRSLLIGLIGALGILAAGIILCLLSSNPSSKELNLDRASPQPWQLAEGFQPPTVPSSLEVLRREIKLGRGDVASIAQIFGIQGEVRRAEFCWYV